MVEGFVGQITEESIFPIHDELGRLICKSCGQPYVSWNIYDLREKHKGQNVQHMIPICLKCEKCSCFYGEELRSGCSRSNVPVTPPSHLSVFRHSSVPLCTVSGHLNCLACSHALAGFTVKGTLALLGRLDKAAAWIACEHCKGVSEYGVRELISVLPEKPVKKLSVGEKILEKTIVEVHEGGMGVVYICHKEGRFVAIKTLRPELSRLPQAEARFIREAEAWIRLGHHPNIVEALYLGFDNGQSAIEIEFQEMGSLASILAKGRLSLSNILEFAKDFCKGMTHADLTIPGFVHRDIKPANCLIGSDGRLRVSDFGLAKILDAVPFREGIDTNEQSADTKYHTRVSRWAMGTLPYMAPEQFEAFSWVDVRSDVYSFGVMLYEMITGELPIVPERAESFVAWRAAHLKQQPYPPTILYPIIPENLSKLVMRCLSKEPSERPQHFSEVLEGLLVICSQKFNRPIERTIQSKLDEVNSKDEAIYDLNLIQPFNLVQVGMHQDALAYSEKIVWVASQSGHPDAALVEARGHALRAMVLTSLKKVEDAKNAANDALALNENDPLALYEAGWCANHTGDFRIALSFLEKSFLLDPARPTIHFELGFAYNAVGNYSRAIELLSERIESQREDFLLHREIAYAFLHTYQDQAATTHYEEAAQFCPPEDRAERASISANLSILYSRNGDKDKAQFYWEQASTLAPRGSAIYKSLFRLEGATELEEALIEYILHKEGPWFKYHLPHILIDKREFADRNISTFFKYLRSEVTSGPSEHPYYLGDSIFIEIEGLHGIAGSRLLISEGKLCILQIYSDLNHSLPWPFKNLKFKIKDRSKAKTARSS